MASIVPVLLGLCLLVCVSGAAMREKEEAVMFTVAFEGVAEGAGLKYEPPTWDEECVNIHMGNVMNKVQHTRTMEHAKQLIRTSVPKCCEVGKEACAAASQKLLPKIEATMKEMLQHAPPRPKDYKEEDAAREQAEMMNSNKQLWDQGIVPLLKLNASSNGIGKYLKACKNCTCLSDGMAGAVFGYMMHFSTGGKVGGSDKRAVRASTKCCGEALPNKTIIEIKTLLKSFLAPAMQESRLWGLTSPILQGARSAEDGRSLQVAAVAAVAAVAVGAFLAGKRVGERKRHPMAELAE